MSKTYRILSLDGGPSTVTYLRLLRVIEEHRPGFLDRTDCFAGTSDGAWAGLYLSSRPEGMTGLQRLDAAIEFNRRIVGAMRIGIVGMLRLATGVFSAIDNRGLARQLEAEFGYGPTGAPLTMAELNRDLCVVTFHLHDQPMKPGVRFIHNFARHTGPNDELWLQDAQQDLAVPLYEAALRTGAFPVMLPVRSGYADGGLFANNPAMCGLTQAHAYRGPLGFRSTEDMVVMSAGADDLSIGGDLINRVVRNSRDLPWGWGPWLLLPWAPLMLLSAVVSASGRGVAFQTRELLRDRFIRLAPPMGEPFGREMMHFVEGRTARMFRRADEIAARWAEGDNSMDCYPPLSRTLAWVDRVWMHDPAPPRVAPPVVN